MRNGLGGSPTICTERVKYARTHLQMQKLQSELPWRTLARMEPRSPRQIRSRGIVRWPNSTRIAKKNKKQKQKRKKQKNTRRKAIRQLFPTLWKVSELRT